MVPDYGYGPNKLCYIHFSFFRYYLGYLGILGIFTPPKIATETHFHEHYGTRATPIILPADRESF